MKNMDEVETIETNPLCISAYRRELDQLRAQLAEAQAEIDELNFASDVQRGEIERLRIRLIRDTVPDTATVQRKREEDAECYSKARTNLCDRIEELHTKLSAAKSEIEEWRGKHDVACLTITKLQKQYEGQLAATSKAMEASVDLLACQATNEKLREAVGMWIGIASNCAIESGCCHCGDSMDNHASPFVCGHSPVDMADTAVSHAIEKSDKALALPNDTTALNAALAAVYEECAKVCDARFDKTRSSLARSGIAVVAHDIRALAKKKGVA